MNQVLSLAFRPKKFSEMVGAAKLIKRIRGHIESGREPQAWMFIGPTGAGKTTFARILALSLQCTHQKQFGNPCQDCRQNRKRFDILEVNAGKSKKLDDISDIIQGWYCAPRPGSRKRIYILDELQQSSEPAQNMLLKLLEDCPATTVWILCTTDPMKVIPTLRGRCAIYTVPNLELEEIRALVTRAIEAVGGNRDADELAEALMEAGVDSPRAVLWSVEKYLAGSTAEEAAHVEVNTNVDIHALNKAIFRGNWRDAAKWLRGCNKEDAIEIRGKLATFLREVLLNDNEFSDRNEVAAEAIKSLANMDYMGEDTRMAVIAAVAYQLAHKFRLRSTVKGDDK